jgi:peroxiredoxin
MNRRGLLIGAAALALGSGAAEAKDEKVSAYRSDALRDHDDRTTSLARAAGGGRLVVVVMKGSWCDVCVGQLRELARRREDLVKLSARVVGLSPDPVAKNKKVAADNRLPWPILTDGGHEVTAALGLWREDWGHPLPAIVVFDRCGIERARIVGRAPNDGAERQILRLLRQLEQRPERCSVT